MNVHCIITLIEHMEEIEWLALRVLFRLGSSQNNDLLTMTYDNYIGISTEIALLEQSKAFPTIMNPPPFGLPMAHPPWSGADNYHRRDCCTAEVIGAAVGPIGLAQRLYRVGAPRPLESAAISTKELLQNPPLPPKPPWHNRIPPKPPPITATITSYPPTFIPTLSPTMSPRPRKHRSTGNYGRKDPSLHGFTFKPTSPEKQPNSRKRSLDWLPLRPLAFPDLRFCCHHPRSQCFGKGISRSLSQRTVSTEGKQEHPYLLPCGSKEISRPWPAQSPHHHALSEAPSLADTIQSAYRYRTHASAEFGGLSDRGWD